MDNGERRKICRLRGAYGCRAGQDRQTLRASPRRRSRSRESPFHLIPDPKIPGRAEQVRQIVAGVGVAVAADLQTNAEAAGTGPAASHVVAPELIVEAEAENLFVAGGERLEPAAGETPALLIPQPDAAVGAVQEHEVTAAVVVAATADVEGDAVAARRGPAAADAVAP